ncbi:hypothetical protein AB0B45_40990 [Nonomuraea sp. NPDC049152]|uniref:hypothetical protein n=1 Tax=Nonomuraea sp. NPDC049152 TaxID=3154350 RepID=UPI0033EF1E8D
MADFDLPDDLIAAQRAYDEADARVEEVTAELPSSVAAVSGEAEFTDKVEQVTEPATEIVGRPTVQLDLHPPYREEGRISVRPSSSVGIHRRIFGHRTLLLA